MTINTQKLNHAPEFDALCDDAKTRVEEVDVDTVEAMLTGGQDFTLIDVRDADEFDAYRIEGAVFLSKGWAEAKIHTVASKDDEIVLYCGGGNRSVLVADNLQRMGYSNVLSMAGGIKAWVNAEKAVLKG